jgi:hypothetical protein
MNSEQIKAIQAGDGPHRPGIDWNGKPLSIDGVWGPKTAWWAGILSLPVQRQNIVRIALSHNGKKEDAGRPNRSVWIDSIQKPAGIGVGNPWCALFLSNVLREAGLEDWPYHAKVSYLIEWARKEGRITTSPLPGDIFGFLYNEMEKDSPGHCGGVLASDALWQISVEGNVGDSVKVGKRARQGLTFIRTVPDVREVLAMPPLKDFVNLDGTRASASLTR